ncbi:MAG: class I SAM-dependent methyltransferase [Candidatus Paceibacterota bacterium]
MSYWDKVSEEYDILVENKDLLRTEILNKSLVNLLGDLKDKDVLDAGCGQGYLSNIISKRGGRVIGIDNSKKLISIAKKKYGFSVDNFEVENLKNKLTFDNDYFDVVVCSMVLMDFNPIEKTIKEFYRIMKTKGSLIISLPHPAFFTGKLHKTFLDKVMNRVPHYDIKKYKEPFKKMVEINGLSEKTPFYHRSIEYYVSLLLKNGFSIKGLEEPVLNKDNENDINNFLKLCMEIPPFLLIKAEKSS